MIYIIGFIFPANVPIRIVLKLSANDFYIWNEIKSGDLEKVFNISSTDEKRKKILLEERQRFNQILNNYPIIELSNYKILSILSPYNTINSNLAWEINNMNITFTRFFDFFIRYSIFNFVVLIFIVLFRQKLINILTYFSNWLKEDIDKLHICYPKFVLIIILLFFLTAHSWRYLIGFYYPGVAGWTYQGRKAQYEIHTTIKDSVFFIPNNPKYLMDVVIRENMVHFKKLQNNLGIYDGKITVGAMFLHYDSITVLPANYELTEIVFPAVPYGTLYNEVKYPNVFLKNIKQSLLHRRNGNVFLLPTNISYPNHDPYMFIDYTNYPKNSELDSVCMWRITYRIKNENISVQNAIKTVTIINNEKN